MLKKVLLVVGVVGVAAFVFKKVRDANDDRAVWHEATTTSDLR